MKSEILNNLKNSTKIIKYYIFSNEREYFNIPEVSITDYEIHNETGLEMVMLSIKFKTYCEPELQDFIKDIKTIENKLSKLLSVLPLTNKGKTANKDEKENLIYFIGSFLIGDLKYSVRDAEIEIELDAMYH